MSWATYAAIFFVMWWLVLFAVLPFGVRTHGEDDDVTLGTVASAPRRGHMRRAALWTTVVTIVLCGLFYGAVEMLDLGFDDIPRIAPDLSR